MDDLNQKVYISAVMRADEVENFLRGYHIVSNSLIITRVGYGQRCEVLVTFRRYII